MKLIIDVDPKLVRDGFERPFTEEEKNILVKAIGNCTPLVVEQKKIDKAINEIIERLILTKQMMMNSLE